MRYLPIWVSSHHFDSEQGFSFRTMVPLDMRMNKRAGDTAADIINTYDEERTADIFYLYGELKNSRKLASRTRKGTRAGQKITTIGEFLEVIKPLFGQEREKGKSFSGHCIRSKSGNGSAERDVVCSNQALKPGGRLLSNHVSLV